MDTRLVLLLLYGIIGLAAAVLTVQRLASGAEPLSSALSFGIAAFCAYRFYQTWYGQ